MATKRRTLCNFAQMHIYLYAWESQLLKTIADDLHFLVPSLPTPVKALQHALDGLSVVESRSVGESATEFVYAHRINDILAIRYVRNERENRWTKWQSPYRKQRKKRQSNYFGHATLLQCEIDLDGMDEHVLSSALSKALTDSDDYARLSLDYCSFLPFGHLFELDPSQVVWLLVNESDEERATLWMTVDWLRLIVFLKKHAHYTKLLAQITATLEKELTRIVKTKENNPQFNSFRAEKLFGECLLQCEMILKNNLSAAKVGYSNSLQDTFGVSNASGPSNTQDFLLRLQGQLRLSDRVYRKQLKNLRRRWEDIKGPEGVFDVFLCHNSIDKPEVREVARLLETSGLRPWLDEEQLQPGLPWQETLEEQISTIRAAAILVGASDLGPWQTMELRTFLDEFVRRRCPVIPVLLWSVSSPPNLPLFLRNLTWVDFRKDSVRALKLLIWGITGNKPAGFDA